MFALPLFDWQRSTAVPSLQELAGKLLTHNRLKQAAEPGRTKAEIEEHQKKSYPCSCSRHHRNKCDMGPESCPQVSAPASHPGKRSSLYAQNNFCIFPLVLMFLCFTVSQDRNFLGVLTSPLSQPTSLLA